MALSEESKLLIRVSAENATAKAFGEVGHGLDNLKKVVVATGAAFAGAFALKNVIDSMRRVGDEVDRLQDSFGLTARQASQLRYVAGAVGLSVDELDTSFGALNKKIIEQMQLMAKGEDDFTKWGVAVRGANGEILSFENILQNVRARMRELPEGFARSGAALDLFGKGGRQMLDFLSLSDDKVHSLMRHAEEFGAVLDDKGASDLVEFNRNIAETGQIFEGLKVQLGNALLPAFNALLSQVPKAAGTFKAFGEAMRRPIGLVKEMLARLGAFLDDIRKLGFGEAIVHLLGDVMSRAGEILGNVATWLTTSIPKWIDGAKQLVTGMIGWFRTVGWPAIVSFFETNVPRLAEWITGSIPVWLRNLGDLLGSVIGWIIGDFIPDFFGALMDVVPKLGEWGRNLLGWFVTTGIPMLAQGALELGKGIVGGIFDGLGKLYGRMGEWIKTNLIDPLRAEVPLVGGIFDWIASVAEKIGQAIAFVRQLLGLVGQAPPPQPPPAPTQFTAGPSGTGPNLGPPPPPRFTGGPSGTGPNLGAPAATLDDIYAAYNRITGGEINYDYAKTILEKGLTYQQVAGGNPFLAEGGIVTRPTRAVIGEDGPEAIIPLNRWTDRGGGGGGDIIIQSGAIVIHGDVDSRDRVAELADAVADRLLTLTYGAGQARYR